MEMRVEQSRSLIISCVLFVNSECVFIDGLRLKLEAFFDFSGIKSGTNNLIIWRKICTSTLEKNQYINVGEKSTHHTSAEILGSFWD